LRKDVRKINYRKMKQSEENFLNMVHNQSIWTAESAITKEVNAIEHD